MALLQDYSDRREHFRINDTIVFLVSIRWVCPEDIRILGGVLYKLKLSIHEFIFNQYLPFIIKWQQSNRFHNLDLKPIAK